MAKCKELTIEQRARIKALYESKCELFGTNRRVYVRRRKGERLINDCISSTVKHGGGNIMVWGSMSGTGLGGLVKIDG